MVGGVFGMVCFLDGFEARLFHVGFVGRQMGDRHLYWECTFPPLVEIRENPEFHDLMRMDKGHWPRFLALAWFGYPCFLGLMVSPLGLLMRLKVLVTLVKLLLGVTLLV